MKVLIFCFYFIQADLTLTKTLAVENSPAEKLDACFNDDCEERSILDDYKDLFIVSYYLLTHTGIIF